MSAPTLPAVVHVAAPVVYGTDEQWCRECGAVLAGAETARVAWPTGAWVAVCAGGASYVLTLFGVLSPRPLLDNERLCTDRRA